MSINSRDEDTNDISEDSTEQTPLLNKVGSSSNIRYPKEVSRKHFKKTSISAVRDPYHVQSNVLSRNASIEDLNNHAQYNRIRYYSKINTHSGNNAKLIPPDHVLPRILFWPHVGGKDTKQSSIITIFAIWNTMMGTSILSLPWAMQQSGFALGIILLVAMGIICLYTCLLIVKSTEGMPNKESIEFVDVCQVELGRFGWYTAFGFGLIAFLGAIVVYWVLLSNFLYQVGTFTHDHIYTLPHPHSNTTYQQHQHADIICHVEQHINQTNPHPFLPASSFYKYWNKQKTVPFFLLILLVPLSSLKSPTFFTKFNALGTVSVVYILVFVAVKSAQWGPHLHFNVPLYDAPSKLFSFNFPALSGILALALYIHNAILSILATNKKPENNARDVSVAYSLTVITYCFVAIVFYSCFPLDKDCIAQVFLDNFVSTDIMAFVARCGLLFQMTTVFPLLMYIVRVQVLTAILNKSQWSYPTIVIMNLCIISLGVLMAVFYPNVGHIIRYVGSVSGMVYIFALPSLVVMLKNHKTKKYKKKWQEVLSCSFYSILICLGILNFISQFFLQE